MPIDTRASAIALACILLACGKPAPEQDAGPTPVPAPAPSVDIASLRPPVPIAPVAPPKPDPRTAAQIAIAACTAADGSWHCSAPRPKVYGAGRPPIIPASWTVPNWYIDPANGTTCASDNSTCTSATCAAGGVGPCKTWAEIVARYGTISPILAQNTTVTQLSSHTDDSDPIVWHPWRNHGAIVRLVGGAPTVLASGVTLASVTPRNRTAGANSDERADIGASGAAGVRIQNTTRANSFSYAFRRVSGNIWELDQPYNPLVVPFAQTPPTQNTAWANTDSVIVQQPIQSNIASLDSLPLEGEGTGQSGLYVTGINFWNPPTGPISNVWIGRHVHIGDCVMQRNPWFDFAVDGIINRQMQAVHVLGFPFNSSTSTANDPVFVGGAITAGSQFSGVFLDGDVIVAGINTTKQGFFGSFYLDQQLSVVAGGAFTADSSIFPDVIYGSANAVLAVTDTSRLSVEVNTFVSVLTAPKFIAGTGLRLNNSLTASTRSGANPDVITTGVLLTPLNLDAAGVPGAFNLGGAAFQKTP